MKPRKQRRQEARDRGIPFEPKYNGEPPKSHKEIRGVGYERFDNKFAKVSELITEGER